MLRASSIGPGRMVGDPRPGPAPEPPGEPETPAPETLPCEGGFLPRLLASDLDGTLSERGAPLGAPDLEMLEALGRAGVVRVIATGRSLWSARQVLRPDTPIDYLVFSSGAGVVRWPGEGLVEGHRLEPEAVRRARAALEEEGLSHMVHAPPPGTHRFAYVRLPGAPSDFDERVARYEPWCEPLSPGGALPWREVAHLVAIVDCARLECLERLREALPDLEIVRTTSPLNGRSLWIELFPPNVSKAHAVARIAGLHGIGAGSCVAVGNDWNDVNLLRWSGHPYVVAGAPAPLRERYPVLAGRAGEVLAGLPCRGVLLEAAG